MKSQISQALNALTQMPNVLGACGQACIHLPANLLPIQVVNKCSKMLLLADSPNAQPYSKYQEGVI